MHAVLVGIHSMFVLSSAGSSLITGTGESTAPAAKDLPENMTPVLPPPVAADPSEQKFPGLDVRYLNHK